MKSWAPLTKCAKNHSKMSILAPTSVATQKLTTIFHTIQRFLKNCQISLQIWFFKQTLNLFLRRKKCFSYMLDTISHKILLLEMWEYKNTKLSFSFEQDQNRCCCGLQENSFSFHILIPHLKVWKVSKDSAFFRWPWTYSHILGPKYLNDPDP